MEFTKTFTIDCKTWRCGKHTKIKKNRLGIGTTCLLNKEGYMCCLGQVAKQELLESGNVYDVVVSKNEVDELLFNTNEPEQLDIFIPLLNEEVLTEYCNYTNTDLSFQAMGINDNQVTTIKEKIEKLTNLFNDNGYQLNFINQPV